MQRFDVGMKNRTIVWSAWGILSALVLMQYVGHEVDMRFCSAGTSTGPLGYWEYASLTLPFGWSCEGGWWLSIVPILWLIIAIAIQHRTKDSPGVALVYVFTAWLAYAFVTVLLSFFTRWHYLVMG